MKKIVIGMSLVAMTSAAFAAAITSGTAVTDTDCTLLNESVTPQVSQKSVAAYGCNTTTGLVGIAVGSTAGKQKIFIVNSSGGKVAASNTACAAAACAAGEVSTVADAVAAGTGS